MMHAWKGGVVTVQGSRRVKITVTPKHGARELFSCEKSEVMHMCAVIRLLSRALYLGDLGVARKAVRVLKDCGRGRRGLTANFDDCPPPVPGRLPCKYRATVTALAVMLQATRLSDDVFGLGHWSHCTDVRSQIS